MKRGDWLLFGVSICAAAASVLLRLQSVRLAGASMNRWAYSSAALPFPVRFALDRQVTSFVIGGCILLTICGAIAFALSRSRRWGRTLLVLQTVFALASVIVATWGVFQLRNRCVFPVAPELACCPCPRQDRVTFQQPLECHCGSEGAVRETVWSSADFEGSGLGDRLLLPAIGEQPAAGRKWMTAKSVADGLVYSIGGSAEHQVRCRYLAPCPGQLQDCGRCDLEEERDRKPVEISPGFSCIDVTAGGRPLSGFVQLRRTVWPDEAGELSAAPDEARAIPTEKSELIGSLNQLEVSGDRGLTGAALGAGQMPPMRVGGVRLCRLPSTLSPMLTGQLNGELTTGSAIVRLEAIDEAAR